MPTPGAGKGQQKIVSAAIKYGPLAYAAARKYGPEIVDQLRREGLPGASTIESKISGKNHRKLAFEHADSVVDGSVMQVFHHSEPYWIVFSGEEPIAAHPRTNIPWDLLLAHADLSKRTRPSDARGVLGALRRVAPGRDKQATTAPAPATGNSAQTQAPADSSTPATPPRRVAEGRIVDDPRSRDSRR